MFLSVSQELSDHLPAEALPLQDEASNPNRSVRYKTSLYQVLDPLLRLPIVDEKKSFSQQLNQFNCMITMKVDFHMRLTC